MLAKKVEILLFASLLQKPYLGDGLNAFILFFVHLREMSRLIPVFSSDVFYLFKLRTKILKVCLDEVCEITVTYGDWLLFLIFGARKLEQSGSFHKSFLLVQRNPLSSLIFGECVFFRHVFSRVNSIKPFACQRKLVLVNWAVEGTCNNTS